MAGYSCHAFSFSPQLWPSEDQRFSKSLRHKFFKGAQIHMVCPCWVCHWTGNCFSCWCFDSLTSTCTSVSGIFLFQFQFLCVVTYQFFFLFFFMIFVKFVGIFCKYLCIQILFAQFFLAVYWSIVYIWLHIKLTSTNLSQQLLWSALLVQIFASMRFLVSFIGLYGW